MASTSSWACLSWPVNHDTSFVGEDGSVYIDDLTTQPNFMQESAYQIVSVGVPPNARVIPISPIIDPVASCTRFRRDFAILIEGLLRVDLNAFWRFLGTVMERDDLSFLLE